MLETVPRECLSHTCACILRSMLCIVCGVQLVCALATARRKYVSLLTHTCKCILAACYGLCSLERAACYGLYAAAAESVRACMCAGMCVCVSVCPWSMLFPAGTTASRVE